MAPEPGKPLIDLATDLEALPGAIVTPAARALRRPLTADLVFDDGGSLTRKASADLQGPSFDNGAFTGTGLLSKSKSKRAQGGIGHGYGVKSGDRNAFGEPLVDIKVGSQFADGSLLRQVEAHQGVDEWGLVVDREKRIEGNVRVGEGV